MKINRRSIAAGLTIGVLAGGAGGAIAATTSGSKVARTPWTTGGWDGYGSGWSGGGSGWGGSGAGWRGKGAGWGDPTTGNGGSAWRSDTTIGRERWMSFARSGRQAAQTYLGLSASQLRSRLQSGATLAEIASGQGKSVAGLQSAIESAVTDSVNADSALTASQKSAIIANLSGVVNSVATGTWDGAAGPSYGAPYGPMTGGGWVGGEYAR